MTRRHALTRSRCQVLAAAGLLCLAAGAPVQAQDCPDGPAELEQLIEFPAGGIQVGFGWDVSLDGDTLATGSPGWGGNDGRVHVYQLRSGSWELDARLSLGSATTDFDNLGWRIALHGDVLAATFFQPEDPSRPGLRHGAVAVFERSGGSWDLVTIIEGSSGEPEGGFGWDIDVHGDTILIGSAGSGASGGRAAGAVEVHVRGPGGWELQQRIEEPAEFTPGTFGGAVALWGDLAAVGYGERSSSTQVVAILRRSGDTWEFETIIEGALPGLGFSVDVQFDRLLAGGRDHARLYRHAGGGVWEVEQDLVAASGFEFRSGVALRAPNAIVAHRNSTPFGARPALAVFRFDGTSWTERASLLSDPGTFHLGLHIALALDGDRAVLGTPWGLFPSSFIEGGVYVFACGENSPPTCDAGTDRVAPCDGVELLGTAGDADGQELLIAWTSSCPGTVFLPGPDVLAPFVTFGDSCGRECELTLTVDDGAGGTCADTLDILIDDLTPPELIGLPGDATVSCEAVPAAAVVTGLDSCDPAPRIDFEEERADGPCPHTYTLLRSWTATDACGNSVLATQRIAVVDDQPPRLGGIPADARVDCAAVPPPIEPSVEDDCDAAPTVDFAETRIDGPCAGSYDLVRRWTAADSCGNVAVAERRLEVRDTTPPVITPSDAVGHCLWPPAHGLRSFGLDQFTPEVSDDCSPPTSWRFAGCSSDQPDDGLGDGHTTVDCLVDQEGRRLRVRSERSGRVGAGRFVDVLAEAVDACGNWSEPVRIGRIHVPHDAAHRDPCPGER